MDEAAELGCFATWPTRRNSTLVWPACMRACAERKSKKASV